MKTLPLLFALFALPLLAAEPVRTWTDTQGRKLVGTLKDKTDTHAEVLRKDNGKSVKLKLSDLSKEDQEYVEAADVMPDPVMAVKTVNVDSNEAGTKNDHRRIAVQLNKLRGRSYSLEVIWLGPKGNTVGVYKSEAKDVSEDGLLHFSVLFRGSKNGVGPDYKGYAVALIEDGDFGERIVAKAASQKPFERFLEEEGDE